MPHKILILTALFVGIALFVAVPALIALVRKHPERRLIYKLTPLALLSFILWMVLLAWAYTGVRDDAVISRYAARLRGNNKLPLAIGALVAVGMAGSLAMLLR